MAIRLLNTGLFMCTISTGFFFYGYRELTLLKKAIYFKYMLLITFLLKSRRDGIIRLLFPVLRVKDCFFAA